MILATMVFLFTVSILASAAALAGEAGLRRLGISGRWVWLGAMAFGPLLLLADALPPLGLFSGVSGAPAVLPVMQLPGLITEAGMGSAGPALLAPFIASAWALLSLGLVAWLARGQRILKGERLGWQEARVLERAVFLSPDRGPAVAGIREPWIILPRWVLALPAAQLRMILLHEEEHVRARDPALLLGALALLVATPWNPVNWWHLHRLRMAVEVDCDRRVLRRVPDRRTYAESPFTVSARATGPTLGLAAFTERSLSLQRRIVTMTSRTSRTRLFGAVLVTAAAAIGAQACAVNSLTAPETPSPREAQTTEAEISTPQGTQITDDLAREPTLTPYTRQVILRNREEVGAALEEEYPALLRGAGVGGRAEVWLLIDAQGVLRDTRIDQSSGHEALDLAALRVARVMRFSPAMNGEVPVPVWVSIPITFVP